MTVRPIARLAVLVPLSALTLLFGCPDDPMTCDEMCSDGGDGNSDGGDGDGDPDGGAAGGIDCSACSADQLCWYTEDENGDLSETGCLDYPASCAADATCTCVNAADADESPCDELGYAQNSNACEEMGGRPVLYCVSTLG